MEELPLLSFRCEHHRIKTECSMFAESTEQLPFAGRGKLRPIWLIYLHQGWEGMEIKRWHVFASMFFHGHRIKFRVCTVVQRTGSVCVFFTSQHLFSRLNILTTCTPRCTDVAMCFTPPGLCMVLIPLRTFYASHSHRLGLCFVPYYWTQTLKTPSVLWLQLKDSIIVKYRGQLGGAKAEEGKGGNCIL